MAKRKAAKKPATKKAAAIGADTKPGHPFGESKTSLILAYAKENPTASTTEIAEALGKTGVVVSPNYVSNIKSKAGKGTGKKRKGGKRGRKPGAVAKAAKGGEHGNGMVSIAALGTAARLINECGGHDFALATIKAVAGIQVGNGGR